MCWFRNSFGIQKVDIVQSILPLEIGFVICQRLVDYCNITAAFNYSFQLSAKHVNFGSPLIY